MTVKKVLIDPSRLRVIPQEGFSWIDRRFVREGFIDRLPREAILLYFFLAVVSDAEGLSFYADPTIGKMLKLNAEELNQSRARLINSELILYRYPLYQVLTLPQKMKSPPRSSPDSSLKVSPREEEPLSLGEILRLAIAKTLDPESPNSIGKERK